jgi:hypothetical protein
VKYDEITSYIYGYLYHSPYIFKSCPNCLHDDYLILPQAPLSNDTTRHAERKKDLQSSGGLRVAKRLVLLHELAARAEGP